MFWRKKTQTTKPREFEADLPTARQRIVRSAVRIGLGCAVAMLVFVGVLVASRALHHRLAKLDRFTLDPRSIRLTRSAPQWVLDNRQMVADLEAAHGLKRPRGLLDDGQLAREVADNLARCPWIREVTRVVPSQEGLDIRFKVRRPVAGVRYKDYYVLVDRDGVRLPGAYRDWPIAWMDLPVVARARTAPPAPGTVWNEPAVRAGTELARLVDSYRGRLTDRRGRPVEIAAIDVSNYGGRVSRTDRDLVLVTDEGVRVLFGRDPLNDYNPGESSPQEKMRLLAGELRRIDTLQGFNMDIDVAIEGMVIRRARSEQAQTASR